MDAIAVMSAIDIHRKDVKFLVNDLLLNIPQLRGIFVGVNKFEILQEKVLKRLIRPLREIRRFYFSSRNGK